MVRALASYQCGPVSIPGPGIICGLSLLLVLYSAPRGFSQGTPDFSKRVRQVLKRTMIGQMAIAKALLGFNDIGCSVTPTFLFRNRYYLQLSPHCSKMNKKSMWEVKKNSRYLSPGHGILPSCGCKAHKTIFAKYELIL